MSYLTDEEKAEAIKKWWAENATAVLGGIVLGLVGLFGWHWWTDRQEQNAGVASELFVGALSHIEAGRYPFANNAAQQLTETSQRTPYPSLGWVLLADLAVREGDLQQAVVALEEARSTARDEGFRQVVSLRLARHLVALERLDEAEQVVSAVVSEAFAGLVAEVRGDIALARGDQAGALSYYEQAQAAGLDTEFLRLKLDELSA